jgi:isopenicillin-N epimerase
LEPAINQARSKLSAFLGTTRENLVFVDNATYGMNVVLQSLQLKPDDEVLVNNHEYGAVKRICERRCQQTGARLVEATLPEVFTGHDEIVDAVFQRVTAKTRLIIFSHITSPTAITVPVKEICRRARANGIATCVDGPHAPVQVDIELNQHDCDFYVASCHKWLCAPLGSGFLYAHPRAQGLVQPLIKSWGRLLPAVPERWDEEFTWIGTRDPSPFLAVPAAIDFMESVGISAFRERTHHLAKYARGAIEQLTGCSAIMPDDSSWYQSMAHVPLPSGDWSQLQAWLWNAKQIEIPIVHFGSRWFVRVSCHLYTLRSQIDYLLESLHQALRSEA